MTEEKKYEKVKLDRKGHKPMKTMSQVLKGALCVGALVITAAKNPEALKGAKDSFLKK